MLNIVNRFRYAFNLDSSELAKLKEEFEGVLSRVEMPKKHEVTANATIVKSANLALVETFPLAGRVRELFRKADSFPDMDDIHQFAEKCVKRDEDELLPLPSPWKGTSHEVDADEVLAEAISAVKNEKRFGEKAAEGLWEAVRAQYDQKLSTSDAFLNAKRAAAFKFALTWLDTHFTNQEKMERRAVSMQAFSDQLAAQRRDKALRIHGRLPLAEQVGKDIARGAMEEINGSLFAGAGRLTDPAKA